MHGVVDLFRFLRASSARVLKMANANNVRFKSDGTYSYEAAIDALNSLQSNAEYLKNRRSIAPEKNTHEALRANCIDKVVAFLARSHIDISRLPSVIHVAGTKGKGSTCALCESILRHHGYSTGFYSSPHLLNVTERIRINGKPIDDQLFARTFWEIYTELCKTINTSDPDAPMPIYFQMLTLVAFKLFIAKNVDVAIVEVGIGGEYDTTNVISKSQVVGITSLGLDHTQILGNTIESIAWHKGGIMKEVCKAFTMPQDKNAMDVLFKRAKEKKCELEVVHPNKQLLLPRNSSVPEDIYKLNATFAIKLAESWMQSRNKSLDNSLVQNALQQCEWQGRFQIIRTTSSNYYLDGAHTTESITHCAKWYRDKSTPNAQKVNIRRVLIFNSTGDRNVDNHLQILHDCNFDRVYFVPNVATSNISSIDNVNHNCPPSEQLSKSALNCSRWSKMFPQHGIARALPSVGDAIIDSMDDNNIFNETLITGSLHLVGASLQAIESIDVNIRNGPNNKLQDEVLNM